MTCPSPELLAALAEGRLKPADRDAVLALLDRVEGEAYVLRGPERMAAKRGQELRNGEGLECKGARSWAIVSFPDETRLEVERDTRIREMFDREAAKGRRLFVSGSTSPAPTAAGSRTSRS